MGPSMEAGPGGEPNALGALQRGLAPVESRPSVDDQWWRLFPVLLLGIHGARLN
jgi:hypothetical protein